MNHYDIYANNLAGVHDSVVIAYDQARSVLMDHGAPTTAHLDLIWNVDDNKIYRRQDFADMNAVSDADKLKLYYQLSGLFKIAMNNKLYS
jgi:hypothetical protein